MFNEIPQKKAMIVWEQEKGLVGQFLVLYVFSEEELKTEGCPGNDYVEQKADFLGYTAGNVYSNWEKWTPAFIIFHFLVCFKFATPEKFLAAFDELMKINEVRESLLAVYDKRRLYEDVESIAFAGRFPWARKE